MIDLHFDKTPNCWKIAIMLEEVGEPYNVIKYDLLKGDHLAPEYGKVNPNYKLPAIVDHDPGDGGGAITVAETGAILIYLAEKNGKFLPTVPRQRAPVLQWLAWQISGLGPMMGQASHFIRYAPERHEYSIGRYQKETCRLMAVLDSALSRGKYIAGDYSIADIASWPLANFAGQIGIGIDLADYPNIRRWGQMVGTRAAIERVFSNPATAVDPGYLQKSRALTAEEWSNIFGERMLAAAQRQR